MKIEGENILYYNAIAQEYNDMLENNSDKMVREKVANKFCSIVKDSAVLDFGGGTGLDIKWLSANNHTVFFCEPSLSMREQAISNHKDFVRNVIFVDDSATNFRQWHFQLPFVEKVDAVLSNFAVLNCISDIELLFQNLALVVKPRANMIALILTKDFKKLLNQNLKNIVTSFIYHKPVTINLQYKKHQQTVYIYSVKEIIKASNKYFNFCNSEVLPASGFTLIHLMRK